MDVPGVDMESATFGQQDKLGVGELMILLLQNRWNVMMSRESTVFLVGNKNREMWKSSRYTDRGIVL